MDGTERMASPNKTTDDALQKKTDETKQKRGRRRATIIRRRRRLRGSIRSEMVDQVDLFSTTNGTTPTALMERERQMVDPRFREKSTKASLRTCRNVIAQKMAIRNETGVPYSIRSTRML